MYKVEEIQAEKEMENAMRNYEMITNISVMIYTTDGKQLWECRNLCEEIGLEENCRFQFILIKDLEAVVRISRFLRKEIDLFVGIQGIEEGIFHLIKRNILKKQPQAHFMIRNEEAFSLADALRESVRDMHR